MLDEESSEFVGFFGTESEDRLLDQGVKKLLDEGRVRFLARREQLRRIVRSLIRRRVARGRFINTGRVDRSACFLGR